MPKLIIELNPDTHKKLKMLALDDDRSLNKYLIRGLEYLANMPVPYHKLSQTIQPQTSTSTLSQTPTISIPTSTSTPTVILPDPSQMSGLEQQEYARKQAAEAKTKIALEKQEQREQAKILSPEEQELNKQKLELQKQKLQEKRDSLIRDKALELGVDFAEDYTEDRLLFEYYDGDYAVAKVLAKTEENRPNKYLNKPIEELYSLLNEIKIAEDKEHAEETRRDGLPHDIDDYDYKSEDFIRDINELKNIWIERGTKDTSYDDDDYNILFNYFYKKRLYHSFEQKMNSPYLAFDDSNNQDIQDLMNAFNRDKSKIDITYINNLMSGDGRLYRETHGMKSYFEEHQEERAEWQRIIDESKKERLLNDNI